MIRDFLISLVSFFIIDPFVADLNEKLGAAQAPAAIIQNVRACAVTAAPIVLDRVMNDWAWAATTAISVSVGMSTPQQVLVEIAPSCNAAVRAAEPFITGGRV